ncbi:MAG: glycoside hydrolase family 30 beta sandwich domain-containing protein [Pseudomonadota bacterium]
MRGFKSVFGLGLLMAAVGLVFVGCGNTSERNAVIRIDPAATYQTMTGWELTADVAGNPQKPFWRPFKDDLLDGLVAEAGINRVRLEITNNAESDGAEARKFINAEVKFRDYKPYRYSMENDNDDPFVINPDGFNFVELDWHIEETVLPIKQRLEARGEKLWVNVCYVAFIEGYYPLKDPEEYAEFVLAAYQHMEAKWGFVPDTWEVILEPDQKPDMWTGREIGEAVLAAGKRLEAHGYRPSFVGPSVLNMSFTVRYFEGIASVPGATDYMSEIAYHRYAGSRPRNARRIAELAEKHDLKTGMLELWFGHANHHVLHEDLRLANNSSWQGSVVYSLYKMKELPDGTSELRISEDMRHNIQYFRHVRLGAKRIGSAVEKGGGVDPLAFVNPDGSTTVVVKTKGAANLKIKDLPAGSYSVSFALPNRSRVLPDRIEIEAGEALTTRIPNKGVITISSRVAPDAPA